VVSPLMLAPVAGHYGIDFMPAHHIITRALGADPFRLGLVVNRAANVITIDQDFQKPLFWTTTSAQVAYRVLVRDRGGHDRTVWARWGRTWLARSDQLELH